MPRISDMFPGRFIRQEDVEEPIIATIAGIHEQDLARPGDAPDFGWVVDFEELEKPVILGLGTAIVLRHLFRSDRTEDWVGKRVELYRDPLVVQRGMITGAIRFRLPKKRRAHHAA